MGIDVKNGYCQTCERPIIYCEHAEMYHAALMQRIEESKQAADRPVGRQGTRRHLSGD